MGPNLPLSERRTQRTNPTRRTRNKLMELSDRTVQPVSQRTKRLRIRTPAEKKKRTLERREARKRQTEMEKERRKGKHEHGKSSAVFMNCLVDREGFSSNR